MTNFTNNKRYQRTNFTLNLYLKVPSFQSLNQNTHLINIGHKKFHTYVFFLLFTERIDLLWRQFLDILLLLIEILFVIHNVTNSFLTKKSIVHKL